MTLTTMLLTVDRLRMSGALPCPLCLNGMDRDNFTFTLLYVVHYNPLFESVDILFLCNMLCYTTTWTKMQSCIFPLHFLSAFLLCLLRNHYLFVS